MSNLETRATAEWSRLAGEAVQVEEINGVLYAYGSELATLRLFRKFSGSGDRAGQGYSMNLQTFYFRLEQA